MSYRSRARLLGIVNYLLIIYIYIYLHTKLIGDYLDAKVLLGKGDHVSNLILIDETITVVVSFSNRLAASPSAESTTITGGADDLLELGFADESISIFVEIHQPLGEFFFGHDGVTGRRS